jgi:hypothetical protein
MQCTSTHSLSSACTARAGGGSNQLHASAVEVLLERSSVERQKQWLTRNWHPSPLLKSNSKSMEDKIQTHHSYRCKSCLICSSEPIGDPPVDVLRSHVQALIMATPTPCHSCNNALSLIAMLAPLVPPLCTHAPVARDAPFRHAHSQFRVCSW